MSTIGSTASSLPVASSPLQDLIAYNQSPAAAIDSPTIIANAQQTVAQTPSQILSSLNPANSSFYGTAPTVDSLIGNISTNSALNALSASHAQSPKGGINPYGSAAAAVTAGQDTEANSLSTLLATGTGSSGDLEGLPAAYYSGTYSALASTTTSTTATPQLHLLG